MKTIDWLLRQYYPGETAFHDRAVAIAAKRAGVKLGTLVNYLKSERRMRRRRRPRRKYGKIPLYIE